MGNQYKLSDIQKWTFGNAQSTNDLQIAETCDGEDYVCYNTLIISNRQTENIATRFNCSGEVGARNDFCLTKG